MAKKEIDYSKIKALTQSILECIGNDQDVGEDPSLPKQDTSIEDGGQDSPLEIIKDEVETTPNSDTGDDEEGDSKKGAYSQSAGMSAMDIIGKPENSSTIKKKRDASLAMMSSMLASKFNK